MSTFPGDIQYEATVRLSDGSVARRRFWCSREATLDELLGRAYDVWSLARVSDRSRMVQPSLEVHPVEDDAQVVALERARVQHGRGTPGFRHAANQIAAGVGR